MIKLKEGCLQDRFNEYASFVLKNGFVYDIENLDAIKSCIEVFEKNESGLMIVGNPGGGKTIFFDMIQKILNTKSPRMFVKISVLDVVLQFNNKEVGHGVFRKWQDKNIFFDDLGTEKKGYLFGEKTEVFELFIQFRYDLFKTNKLKTHFTTNLSKDELNNRYGMRCASRLNEMCDRVLLGNKADYKDRRQYKNFIGLPQVLHQMAPNKEDQYIKEAYEIMKQNAANNPPAEREGLGSRYRKIFGTNPKDITH